MAANPDREPMITDVCVPLSRLPEMMRRSREIVEAAPMKLPGPTIGHAGDGNSHVLLFFNPENEAEVKEAKRIGSELADMAITLGGTCTGEHGIGVGKKEYLKSEMGEASIAVMRNIKTIFDPGNILNPGKVIDVIVKAK